MTFDEYKTGGMALYADFAEAVADILDAAIAEQHGLRLQNIQCRAKEPTSLKAKLAKAGAKADTPIGDVAKDVAGCRVILYTNGDVERFRNSGILRDNFDVDYDRSKMHYPESKEEGAEFFISENWVVKLSEARCALPEYRRFAGLRCEIQIQTILDHAWAEMAHDTIYKPMTDVGFGAAKIEAMRKRLRKVMQEYLQPAGYAFDKIASDYAHLRDGKEMFDGDLPHGLHYLRAPLAAAPGEIVAAARAWFDANPAFSQFHGGRLIAELFPNLEHPLYPLLYGQLEQGREGIDFVLSVLRAYEGEQFLHPLLRAIVGFLPADDELLNIVDVIIDSSGVLVGEYGSVEAQEARKALVAEWEADENQAVHDFAARFIRSAENQLAMERRRADRTVALRNIEFDGE